MDLQDKLEELEYIEQLNRINLLPELLQGGSEKRIICDFDDLDAFEDHVDARSDLSSEES